MGQHSEKFLQYLGRVKRYAGHTVVAYSGDLGQFEGFLADVYGLDGCHQASVVMVRSWFAELSRQGVAHSTFNRKLSALRSFYRYLHNNGVIAENPMLRVSSVKKQRRLPVFVEEDRLMEFFEKHAFENTFQDLRDLFMLELFYATGIRLSELINLRHQDIDGESMQMTVTGKGNKQRIVPLLRGTVVLYGTYCREKLRLFGTRPDQVVFVTDKGMKLYPVFVYRKIRRYLGMVTTRTKKSPHVLRHSFATHMLNRGADLNAIKELLGHASLSATQVYTHTSIEKMKQVYKQAHPKA